jgi:hypothetical protein
MLQIPLMKMKSLTIYDRGKEVKAFEETKACVKELASRLWCEQYSQDFCPPIRENAEVVFRY